MRFLAFTLLAIALAAGVIDGFSALSFTRGTASASSVIRLASNKTKLAKNDTFKVSVIADSTANFNTAQLDIEFTSSTLNLVNVKVGKALPKVSDSMNRYGVISYTIYKTQGTSGNDLTLLEATFKAKASGDALIVLKDSSELLGGGRTLAFGDDQLKFNIASAPTTTKPNGAYTDQTKSNDTKEIATGDQLPESGPGSVLALFIATVLVAYFYKAKRIKRNL